MRLPAPLPGGKVAQPGQDDGLQSKVISILAEKTGYPEDMLDLDADCHVWGLGRHAIGSNFYWYLRDPAGNYAEYSSDIDRISSQDAYVPKDWSGRESLYSWGPPLPAEFIAPPDIEEVIAAMTEG